MVGELISIFMEKVQTAQREFQSGKNIREVLFSDNPGIIPKPKIIEKVTPVVRQVRPAAQIRPVVTPRPVAPTPRTTTRTAIDLPIQKRIAEARAPTDPISTLVRGLARVTGTKTSPPAGYQWLY